MSVWAWTCWLLASVSAGLVSAQTPPAAETRRFALVLGQNRPDPKSAATLLRFADDDAINTHLLLLEAGVESLLLVSVDDDSRGLYPEIRPEAPAGMADLTAGMQSLRAKMLAAQEQGAQVEFLFFYSGHGDVEHGQGFIVLEDGRLGRTDFFEKVLAQSPASTNHVIIDACKSYFLVFEKGTGGSRSPYLANFVDRRGTRLSDNTGVVLSTSADRDSHEWERLQAGVFSHQVRSGLRGAADADRDGQVSYAELGAFLKTANLGIPNPRLRPDFVVRPPGAEAANLARPLLSWGNDRDRLVLDVAELGHVYLEDARGVRVGDAHPAPGEIFDFYLPPSRPLFVRAKDNRQERVLDKSGGGRLSSLEPLAVVVALKGAAHLAFERLFEVPFGQRAVADFEAAYRTRGDPFDALSVSKPAPGDRRSTLQTAALWTSVGSLVLGASMNLWAWERHNTGLDSSQARREELNATIKRLNTAAAVFYSVGGTALAVWLAAKLWPRESDHDISFGLQPGGGVLLFGGVF